MVLLHNSQKISGIKVGNTFVQPEDALLKLSIFYQLFYREIVWYMPKFNSAGFSSPESLPGRQRRAFGILTLTLKGD
ncbi:hypothetical protein ED312_18695 [Sinomicrobium pectinilyticum]|uniref:Uncharacterized protein n=1 Tax=Sinomicrobium pectinilyticum TaxID=1084421 RepID=A0A3N0E1A9_SINP1|nr:hypothetical protein ED312_18695 [Sinomicrobium pectinilyticum]